MADKQTKVNMISSHSWRDHFKIDQSVLEAFWEEFSQSSPLRASEMKPSEAGNSIEFIMWCVQQGHFTEEAFVQWQSQTFEIPVVRQAYFEAPVDTAFWDRVKEIHQWTPTCMPLTEWDDVLLVAVVNASAQQLSLSKRHRVVLAAPSRLRDYFERVDQSSVSKSVFQQNTPAPEFAPNSIAQQEPQAAAQSDFEQTPSIPQQPTIQPQTPAAADDGGDPFAALSRQLGMLNHSHDDEVLTPPPSEASADATPEGLVLPDGLVLSGDLNLGDLGKIPTPEAGPALIPNAGAADSAENSDDSVNFDLTPDDPEARPATMAHADSGSESAPEGGTLVHNFETGADEIITQEKPEAKAVSEATAKPQDAVPVATPETPAPSASSTDNDDPLAALTMPPPEPVKTGKNAGIPDLPFSIPRHETEDPARTEPLEAMKPNPTAPPFEIRDESPPAEAPKTGRNRKPLFAPVADSASSQQTAPPKKPEARPSAFEPRSSKGAGFEATQAVSIQNDGPPQDTQVGSKTGTFAGTQTKSRRLENTPVTSMLGAVQPAIHQERPEGNGGSPTYLNKSIAIGKLDPIHLDQCRSIDEAGAQAILQACNIYECAMILLFRGGDLVPWKWNDLFLSVKGDKPDPIDLVEPSIFKVVFRTAKPYHGYIVTSEVNQKFFNDFYRGMLPKHGTVTPLMIDGRMGGMVLGFTNSKIDYRQSLRLMERLTFDLSRVFKSLRGTMAKAG